MTKKKFSIGIIITIILLLVIALAGLFFGWRYGYIDIFPQEMLVKTTDCVLVPGNVSPIYTYILPDKSYECLNDECLVFGSLFINKTTLSEVNYRFCPSAVEFEYCTSAVFGTNLVEGALETKEMDANYRMRKYDTLTYTPIYTETGFDVEEHWLYIQSFNCPVTKENIIIVAKDEYAIGHHLTEIKVKLPQRIDNIRVWIELIDKYDGQPVGQKIDTTTDPNGEVLVDCTPTGNCLDFKPTKQATYTIRVTVDPETKIYDTPQFINFDIITLPGLRLILGCSLTCNIGIDCKCNWLLRDDTTDMFVIGTPKIEVTQAGVSLYYRPSGSDAVTFIANATGAADVFVTIDKEGYVSDSDFAQVEIRAPTLDIRFYIDNIDYFSLLGGIEIGSHILKLRIEEGGQKVPVRHISAQITTPTEEIIPLSFVEVADGWQSQYEFLLGGHAYHLTGEITFSDVERDKHAINYPIATIIEPSGKHEQTITIAIVGGSIGVLLIIIILVVLFKRKKKKKKKSMFKEWFD